MPLNLTAAGNDDGRRLDRILRKALRDLPLSAIHRLLRKGAVLVDGEAASACRRVKAGQNITIYLDAADFSAQAAPSSSAAREKPAPGRINDKAALEILFEGEGLLIVNKPAGIAVHGMTGGSKGTLEELVRFYLKPKLPPSLSFRPGPLHRLDKMSSGIIVFSGSLEGARFFSSLMRERRIKKIYLALVEGAVKKAETWQDELIRDRKAGKTFTGLAGSAADAETKAGLKTAFTRVRPLFISASYSLIQAEIETGRTHQIRAQAAGRGHPLLGDIKYGGRRISGAQDRKRKDGFLLHAWRMEFPGETPGRHLPRLIEAPLPDNFQKKIRELFGEDAAGTFRV